MPKFLKKASKIFPFTFSMEHLLHRLYGVDCRRPCNRRSYSALCIMLSLAKDYRKGGLVSATGQSDYIFGMEIRSSNLLRNLYN